MAGKTKAPHVAVLGAIAPGGNGLGPEHVLEIQRSRLLAAMVEVCAEYGAANVSVAHVVARAGVSRRTFYELFTDREDCFLATFNEGIARASRYVLDAYDPTAAWVERIRAALAGLLSFLDAEPAMGRLLVVGSLGAGRGALELRRRGIAQIIAVVDEGRTVTDGSRGRAQTGKSSKLDEGLPPLTAEGLVGGVLSVLHSRLVEDKQPPPFVSLTGSLMSMIVLPYLGPAAARKELARPSPRAARNARAAGSWRSGTGDPLRDLGMRLTYRTVRVLFAVATTPGGSNREVADASDISDQGQISKLLARLQGLGLIENAGAGSVRGAANSWILTDRGRQVQGALVRNSS
jgi:AcrR family transcriptional regulator